MCLTLHVCSFSGATGVRWPFTRQCLKQPWKNSSHSRAIRRANQRTLPSSACMLTSPVMFSASSTIRYGHLFILCLTRFTLKAGHFQISKRLFFLSYFGGISYALILLSCSLILQIPEKAFSTMRCWNCYFIHQH